MKGLLFTYALTFGGAAAGLYYPFYGLLAYIALALLKPEFLWYWAVPEGNYSRIVGIALLVGWMVHGFGKWHFGRAKSIVVALVGFWLWSILGASVAADQAVARKYAEELTKIVLPFLVGITVIDSVAKLKQLAWVIVICEGYVAFEMNLSYYGGYNRLQEAGFGGMDNNCNGIAMITVLGFAFFLGSNAPRWWQRAVALGCALALAHAVFIAFSRGAMLAMIITGALACFLIPKRPKHVLILALGLLLLFRLAGAEVQERFMTTFAKKEERDASAEARLKNWQACLQAVSEQPLLGVGPAHWHLVSPRYGLPSMEAHTLWLQLAAEQGILGLALLLLFYGICIVKLWPLAREQRPVSDPWLHDAARMVIASLTGFMVSAQFVSMQGLEVPYYVVLLGAGALKLDSCVAPHWQSCQTQCFHPWRVPAVADRGPVSCCTLGGSD
jgi:probable O-glycosylation ligase (exosortase A-associated)